MNPNNDSFLTAWEVYASSDMAIAPAAMERDWMDRTDHRFAYRCLPLVIANQAGWTIPCPAGFTACWNGGNQLGDLQLQFSGGASDQRVRSHFGYGVLTFTLPYLFRTPPGINLWVKGPSNAIKDGVQALEGVVETDWAESTFTMNWKLTRPGLSVSFEKGEPICMIVPVPRGLAEALHPVCKPLAANAELHSAYEQWRQSRVTFNDAIAQFDAEAVKRGWQRDYMLGQNSRGETFAEHQTKLTLKEFSSQRG